MPWRGPARGPRWRSREEGRASPEQHGCVRWERKSLCCRPIALGAEAGEGAPFPRSPSPSPPRAKFPPPPRRPTRVALCSDPGAVGGGREGSGCSKGQGRASFPSSSLPLPSCSAAQSVTNAKLGAWVGTPPEAMALAWSVPRDSAWAGWITPPKPAPPPTPLEGGWTEPVTNLIHSPGSLWPCPDGGRGGGEVLGSPLPGSCMPWGKQPRRTRPRPCTSGRAFSSHLLPPHSPPPPILK